MKYIPFPIKDDNDVEIVFDVFSLHDELSNIDLYLEIEMNGNKNHIEVAPRTQEKCFPLLPSTSDDIVVSHMIQNEDFGTISQFALVNNAMDSGFEIEDDDVVNNGGDEIGDGDEINNEGHEIGDDDGIE
ncbi:hypothetical protein L2E82_43544 [Cichorium intybus]|uniref:Uncharacterized protein n=1 Tax=Cichorium intybus TaxID=13427 RepID=A0ACB8ZP26_CICIN|nr:hypothetical protein L2E82_43544 [Cichorium intybus]